VTSLLALASIAVFWSGLPFVLGAARAVTQEAGVDDVVFSDGTGWSLYGAPRS
jgi:hypothetical protein